MDGLRFLAFVSVFIHHSLHPVIATSEAGTAKAIIFLAISNCGAFGVCLFFSLSAYLITSLLLKEKAVMGKIDIRAFYVRRILRIWPLYFLFIALTNFIGLVYPQLHLPLGESLALVLLAGNWYDIFVGSGAVDCSHLWGISVEEQFYLLLPAIASLLSPRTLRTTFVLLIPAALGCTYVLTHNQTQDALWHNSAPQVCFFAVGGLLAFRPRHQKYSAVKAAALLCAGIAIWIAAQAFTQIIGTNNGEIAEPWRFPIGYALVAFACICMLSGALTFPPSKVPTWIAYLGRISYGLYLFHGLMLPLFHILFPSTKHLSAVVFVLTLILGHFSYKYIERPFLFLKKRFETVESRPI